jgi:hypothetical protein
MDRPMAGEASEEPTDASIYRFQYSADVIGDAQKIE